MLASPATAATFLVTYEATFERDPSGPTLFGDPAVTRRGSISFEVDGSAARFMPAGSEYAPGLYTGTDLLAFQSSAVTNINFSLAPSVFQSAEILTQESGNLGAFDLLIQGSLAAPTAVNLTLVDKVVGELILGSIECGSVCRIRNFGYGFSYQDAGFGQLFESSVKIGSQPLAGAVPEPATWATMLIGFGAIGYSMRRGRQRSYRARAA
jgi:hypothetical protein